MAMANMNPAPITSPGKRSPKMITTPNKKHAKAGMSAHQFLRKSMAKPTRKGMAMAPKNGAAIQAAW